LASTWNFNFRLEPLLFSKEAEGRSIRGTAGETPVPLPRPPLFTPFR